MKLDTMVVTPWRRVPKPVPRYPSISLLTAKPPQPPKVSPKPGSKVYLYVYDGDTENPASVPQYYQNPHFVKQPSVEEVTYPYAKEKQQRSQPEQAPEPEQKRSGRQKVRDQARRAEKGYKVLAEVTPNLRSSSRGGKMFIKQRNRMDKFTKESQNIVQDENEELNRRNKQAMGASDGWATPWNMAIKSPTAVKYITAKRLPGPMNRGAGFRDPLGFMPRPPDFWRAKVEQNFPSNGPKPPLYRPASAQWHNAGRTTPLMEVNGGYSLRRPESAPPMESPTNYEDHGQIMNDIYSENANDGYYSEYDYPSRPGSVSIPSATIHFNAKHYYSTPHRRHGLRKGIQAFQPTPNVQHDFNARAKGWRRQY